VLAINEAQLVAEVEIARVEAVAHGDVGVHAGIPFATLHYHRRVRDQSVAADMVEMGMRVDDEIDPRWVAVHRFEARADLCRGGQPELSVSAPVASTCCRLARE
jgi:hypothetical protein